MTYQITGLNPQQFQPLFNLSDDALRRRGVIAKTADARPGYPCRITLEDASIGERVLLLNFESHAVPSPYRSAYAIYIREGAENPAIHIDRLPPVMVGRPIALRLFDKEGMLIGADLDISGDLDMKIRKAFDNDAVRYIHAHNAMHGCFSAEITRH